MADRLVHGVDLLLDLLAAPTYWRPVHGRPVDARYLDQLTDLLLHGVAPRG